MARREREQMSIVVCELMRSCQSHPLEEMPKDSTVPSAARAVTAESNRLDSIANR